MCGKWDERKKSRTYELRRKDGILISGVQTSDTTQRNMQRSVRWVEKRKMMTRVPRKEKRKRQGPLSRRDHISSFSFSSAPTRTRYPINPASPHPSARHTITRPLTFHYGGRHLNLHAQSSARAYISLSTWDSKGASRYAGAFSELEPEGFVEDGDFTFQMFKGVVLVSGELERQNLQF